jgi:hypothetical protein
MDEHSTGRGTVSESSSHLEPLILEQFAEGTLPAAKLEEARKHLDSCRRCAHELEAHRSLFAVLSDLPRFAPSPAFAEQVMARVQIGRAEAPLFAWLRRLAPTTRSGWLLLGTVVTAPVTPFLALIALVLVQPLVTPSVLWQWVQLRTQGITQGSIAWLTERLFGVGGWEAVAVAYSAVDAIPASAVLGLFVTVTVGIPLSVWGLVKLTRTPNVSVKYANN